MYRQRCGGSSPFDGTIDSFLPPLPGLIHLSADLPTACAVGCILTPLRGWGCRSGLDAGLSPGETAGPSTALASLRFGRDDKWGTNDKWGTRGLYSCAAARLGMSMGLGAGLSPGETAGPSTALASLRFGRDDRGVNGGAAVGMTSGEQTTLRSGYKGGRIFAQT